MRILVMLLLDTLPMLGNVLLLCFFVFFIFGIVGVQLWKGVLRNRCWFVYNQTLMAGLNLETYNNTFYKPEHTDSFICTDSGTGMSTCADIPPFVNHTHICNSTIETARTQWKNNQTLTSCINWNSLLPVARAQLKIRSRAQSHSTTSDTLGLLFFKYIQYRFTLFNQLVVCSMSNDTKI